MVCGFNWILDNKLAGSGLPGLLSPVEEDMQFLASSGIKLVVTLTEHALAHPAEDYGMEGLHFAIPDMGFPIPRNCETVCRQIVEVMEDGATLLHCRAGLGRTGTMAVCVLITLGADPAEALADVRKINNNYVQSNSQESFIQHYWNYLDGLKAA